MYLDKSLQTYLDDLASAQPTPGGGSAAALTGAMGAALAGMVARLTSGKADYGAVQTEIDELIQQTDTLRHRFQTLMQEDIEAYGRLSACFKMPRETAEERSVRTEAIQRRLLEAALVPLEIVENAVQLVQYLLRIAQIGNKNVLSDVATGAMLASSAGSGAAWMVRINLRSMKDFTHVQELNERLNTALTALSERSQRVIDIIGGRE